MEAIDDMNLPIIHSWRLNERHYGALQGLDKQETVDKYGKDQGKYLLPPFLFICISSRHTPI